MAAPVAGAPPARTLSIDEATRAMTDVVAAFDIEENVEKMAAAKKEAGDDLAKYMSVVFPVAMAIQEAVIKKYDFDPTQQGVMQFTMAIRAHEQTVPEIQRMTQELKSRFMPKMPPPPGSASK